MLKSECKIGIEIENHDKYEGEGKSIITKIDKYGISAEKIECQKYPELVGQTQGISNYELQYHVKV